MNIYLYFKKYYIALGRNLAIYLDKHWCTPNMASIWSLLVIFPMFYLLDRFIDDIVVFFIALFFAINIKLILNAVDGIIARIRGISTKLWMVLNVWTDILPDIYILYLLLTKIWASSEIVLYILWVVMLYFIFEILVILVYNTQNISLWWKESRTFFYILIFLVYILDFSYNHLLHFYILILILHNALFILNEYNWNNPN